MKFTILPWKHTAHGHEVLSCACATTTNHPSREHFSSCKTEAASPLQSNASTPPVPCKCCPLCRSDCDYSQHLSGLIQCLSFCHWFVSLSIVSSESIHVGTDARIFFLSPNIACIVCVACILLVSLSVNGHLGHFCIFAIGNDAAWVYKFLSKTLLLIVLSVSPKVDLLDHMGN